MMTILAARFLTALILSLALIPICRLVAVRLGYVARPREDRWNRRPVALFGGVGIAASLFVSAGSFHLVGQLPVLMGTAMIMFLIGLVDDVLLLKPSTKLI